MSFHDVRFPDQIERGAEGGPCFNTSIAETTGGHEYRQANWSVPRYKWDVATGLKDAEDFAELLAFFNARLGRAYSFRFKDWSDRFAPNGSPVVLVPGTTDVFMCAKAYTSGPVTFLRPITKPVAGAAFASGGALINHLTGVVAGATEATTWGGEFDCCVRFESDEFRLTLEDVTVGQATGVSIVEVRE